MEKGGQSGGHFHGELFPFNRVQIADRQFNIFIKFFSLIIWFEMNILNK